jgi:hypothetical protein
VACTILHPAPVGRPGLSCKLQRVRRIGWIVLPPLLTTTVPGPSRH